VLGLPLGDPHADAAYDPTTTVWTRTFGQGTRVMFNASGKTGSIEWAPGLAIPLNA